MAQGNNDTLYGTAYAWDKQNKYTTVFLIVVEYLSYRI